MISNNTLKTVGVIQEKNGKHIFPVPKKNMAYVIPEKDLQLFFFMRNRYIVVVIITFFVYYVAKFNNYILAGIAGALLIILELYYRKMMLAKYAKIRNFTIAPTRLAKYQNPKYRILHLALYVALALAILYLGYSKFGGTSEFFIYPIAAFTTVAFGFFRVYMSTKKS
jgi:hypothetical protein